MQRSDLTNGVRFRDPGSSTLTIRQTVELPDRTPPSSMSESHDYKDVAGLFDVLPM